MNEHDRCREFNDRMAREAHADGDRERGSSWDRLRDARDQQTAERNARKGGRR